MPGPLTPRHKGTVCGDDEYAPINLGTRPGLSLVLYLSIPPPHLDPSLPPKGFRLVPRMGFYGFYGFGGGYGRRFGGGSRKKKKQPKDNWFERLNQTQIKDLLAAARMPVSGTKKVQIDRLFANPLTCDYGDEKVGYMGDGKTVDSLKADCRSAGLVLGGVKYDLVMRLIKHNAAGIEAEPTPAAVKRAVALAKAQDSLASPAVGGKRKAACEGKAGGKKRAAAAGADAWCESDGDEEDEDEEDEEDEEVRAGPVPRPIRRILAQPAAGLQQRGWW